MSPKTAFSLEEVLQAVVYWLQHKHHRHVNPDQVVWSTYTDGTCEPEREMIDGVIIRVTPTMLM